MICFQWAKIEGCITACMEMVSNGALIGHWTRKGNLIWPSKAGTRIHLPLVGSFWASLKKHTHTENGDNRILKVEENLYWRKVGENLCTCVYISRFSHVPFFVTPWTVARQAPLSMRFPMQEYWSGLPFSSPGDLPDPGIEPRSHALQADSLPSEPVCLCKWRKDQWEKYQILVSFFSNCKRDWCSF